MLFEKILTIWASLNGCQTRSNWYFLFNLINQNVNIQILLNLWNQKVAQLYSCLPKSFMKINFWNHFFFWTLSLIICFKLTLFLVSFRGCWLPLFFYEVCSNYNIFHCSPTQFKFEKRLFVEWCKNMDV